MNEFVKPSEKLRPEDDKIKKQKILDDPDKVTPYISTNKKRRSTKSEYYIDPAEFKKAIESYYETEDKNCENYEYLGKCFLKIATGVTSAACFNQFSWKSDMIGDALVNMTKALIGKKFSLKYGSSPFSYYTQIAYWAICGRKEKEKKQQKIVKNYSQVMYAEQFRENENTKNIYIRPEYDGEIF